MSDKNVINCHVTLYRGTVGEFKGLTTAIKKSLVQNRVYLSLNGIDGDHCADTKHHGGFERALHQYPMEHYQYWQSQFPESKLLFKASAMGENISSAGMTEHNVYIGDQFQLGEAIIEVSQPRSPCFKLSRFLAVEGFAEKVQETNRCGWLYRVITPGYVDLNANLTLLRRAENSLSVYQVANIFFNDPTNKEALLQIAELSHLSQHWKDYVHKRLETGNIENWQARLTGVF
ncbi:MOSC domain-containing protein [Litorilituus lipolyticus]|uniref:MOSC domain-containing protein n=1 Tax=Litorilituus lipolyticus TaxID=2491017 RepID=UPI001BAD3A78|nr:MOSC domain-containing protein [Litorilituus lipolyticus]